jgi:hypothetical protein
MRCELIHLLLPLGNREFSLLASVRFSLPPRKAAQYHIDGRVSGLFESTMIRLLCSTALYLLLANNFDLSDNLRSSPHLPRSLPRPYIRHPPIYSPTPTTLFSIPPFDANLKPDLLPSRATVRCSYKLSSTLLVASRRSGSRWTIRERG